MKSRKMWMLAVGAIAMAPVAAHAGVITAWSFENNPIAVNNNPAPSTGTGTSGSIGMTNSYNSTTAATTDDVLVGKSTDTGSNGSADTTQTWRVRGQSPGNGWSSQAAVATQGAFFTSSTAGDNATTYYVSFDWYSTTQGEANLLLQYTDNFNVATNGTDSGTIWHNLPISLNANDSGLATLTNASSVNTVTGPYISDNLLVNGSLAGQDWFPNLQATITDSAAANNPNFAIRMVNASTGTDCISTQGTQLNNTSGNWRFDNVIISDTPILATPEPASLGVLAIGGLCLAARRRRRVC